MNLFDTTRRAGSILRNRGFLAFLSALRTRLSPAYADPAPNESNMAFSVLRDRCIEGTMVDVGAHFGGSLAPFARSGWRVVAFEPDYKNRKKLLDAFGGLPNVTVDPRGLSDSACEGATLYRSKQSSGISGLSAFHHTHVASDTIDVTTLALACREHLLSQIDFLKIDTEGFDLLVLKGLPWETISPRFVLCEFEDTKTVPLGYTFHDLADFLEDRDYKLIVSEWHPVKRYGGPHQWRCFNTYPCELNDSGAWGNIFAVRENDLYNALMQECRQFAPG